MGKKNKGVLSESMNFVLIFFLIAMIVIVIDFLVHFR